jgi:iron(III) transport system permease protein
MTHYVETPVEPVSATTSAMPPSKGRSPRWRAPKHRKRLVLLAALLLVCLPTLAPVLYVFVMSFSDSFPGQAFHWSLQPWTRVFTSAQTLKSLVVSLILTLRAPIGMAIAFMLAWFLVRVDMPGRKLIRYALWFAFFLPVLPMTFGWMMLIDEKHGLLNTALEKLPLINGPVFSVESIPGILWVHLTLTTVPIITILLMPALQAIDASYEEASDMAGASVFTTLRKVTLPLLAPAMLVALLAGFIRSLETFEVEQLLGVPAGIFVYATRIYNLLRKEPPDYAQAMALSSLLLVVLFIIAVVYQRVLRRFSGNSTLTGRSIRVNVRSRSPRVWAVSVVIYASVVVFLILPFGMLVAGSMTKLFGFFFIKHPWTFAHWRAVFADPQFTAALRTSLKLSLIVAVVGTIAYSLLGTLFARSRSRLSGVIAFASWLPWAIPGLLMGTAFLTIFLQVPGLSGSLYTLFPLALVLNVQGLPLGSQMMSASVNQISPQLEEASYMSGASWLKTYVRVTMPLAAPMFVSVFVVTFMSAIRDISSTVLLAAPGTRTLSLLMFQFATSSEPEVAAVMGVVIASIALAMTVIVLRLGAKFSLR